VCLATSLLLSAIYPRCIDGVSLQSQELKQYSPFGICTSEFILLAFSRYTLNCRTTYIPRSGLCWTRFTQLPRRDLYFGLGCTHFVMAVAQQESRITSIETVQRFPLWNAVHLRLSPVESSVNRVHKRVRTVEEGR
jgi:hypothetical protein